jgi:hypothetical protein
MSTSTRSAYPSLQEIEEARANHSYIRVTGKKNKNISISGIYRTFENHATSNYVYVPALRLMGDPEDVRNAILSLRWMGANGEVMSYTPQEADAYVASGLNKNNYNIINAYVPDDQGGMEDTLLREIEESTEARKGIKKEKSVNKLPPVSLENLRDVWEQVTGKIETTVTKASPSSSRRRQTLAERYRNLAPGKVLDVSAFNSVTGTGAAAKPAPPLTSSKIGVPGVHVVSNNPATYEAAVTEIFGPQEGARLTEQYNRMALQGRRRQRASPVRQVAPARPVAPARNVAPTNLPATQRAAINPPTQLPLIPPTQVPIQVHRTSPRQNRPPLSEQVIPQRPAIPNLTRIGNAADVNVPSNNLPRRPVFSSPSQE